MLAFVCRNACEYLVHFTHSVGDSLARRALQARVDGGMDLAGVIFTQFIVQKIGIPGSARGLVMRGVAGVKVHWSVGSIVVLASRNVAVGAHQCKHTVPALPSALRSAP